MAAHCGLLPVETSDLAECRWLAQRDGAAVLTAEGMRRHGLGCTRKSCAQLPLRLWGSQLRAYALPTEISIQRLPESAGIAAGRQVTFESYQGRPKPELEELIAEVMDGTGGEAKMLAMSSEDQAGGIDYAHTDGWSTVVPGANPRPDFFFLVCERWDPAGGESFLVDGGRLFRTLRPAIQSTLLNLPPLPSKRSLGEPGRPFLSCAQTGRLLVRNGQHSIMTMTGPEAVQAVGEQGDDEEDEDETNDYPKEAQDAILQWSLGVAMAQINAPRFQLKPGEAVLIDNFRMLHGRDPYTDLRRKFWRLWHWTTNCIDVPTDQTVIHTTACISDRLLVPKL